MYYIINSTTFAIIIRSNNADRADEEMRELLKKEPDRRLILISKEAYDAELQKRLEAADIAANLYAARVQRGGSQRNGDMLQSFYDAREILSQFGIKV